MIFMVCRPFVDCLRPQGWRRDTYINGGEKWMTTRSKISSWLKKTGFWSESCCSLQRIQHGPINPKVSIESIHEFSTLASCYAFGAASQLNFQSQSAIPGSSVASLSNLWVWYQMLVPPLGCNDCQIPLVPKEFIYLRIPGVLPYDSGICCYQPACFTHTN